MTEPVIAVIDQDSNFLITINETLADSGYIAILSRGDQSAQILIERERPSLIILDGSLRSSQDGHSLAESVISGAAELNIPMLISTWASRESAPAGDSSAQNLDELPKPIDPVELQAKVRHALDLVAQMEHQS